MLSGLSIVIRVSFAALEVLQSACTLCVLESGLSDQLVHCSPMKAL